MKISDYYVARNVPGQTRHERQRGEVSVEHDSKVYFYKIRRADLREFKSAAFTAFGVRALKGVYPRYEV